MTHQEIKNFINTYIVTNGVGAITAARLNTILNELADYKGFDAVVVTTLPAGSDATATVQGMTLVLGIPRGADGQDAVNPFKGWYTTDNIPTTGQEGDYCNVSDTSVTPPIVTIYRWDDNQDAFVDTGEVPDTATGETFASGETLQEVAIDNSHLENPVNTADPTKPVLAEAEDAMQLKSKLEWVDLEEEKVLPIESGDGQNVFSGYVLCYSELYPSLPPLVYASSGTKHIVIDVEGCDSVRFLGVLAKSTSGDAGWAFYDASNFDGISFKDDNTGAVKWAKYDYDTTLAETTTKEYLLKVPANAKYLKLCYNVGVITPAKFYCYKQYGQGVKKVSQEVEKDIELLRAATANGFIIGGISSDEWAGYFFKGYALTTRLKVNPNDKIIGADNVPNGGTFKVFCFDDGFLSCGMVDSFPCNLPDGTRYIRPQVTFDDEQGMDSIVIRIKVETAGELDEIKEGLRSTQSFDDTKFVSFTVQKPKRDEDSDATLDYLPNGDKSFSNGYIHLAKNYTPDGAPTPVAVFFHGTDGYSFDEVSISVYADQIKFLAKCGYNVIDCSTHSYHQWVASGKSNSEENWPVGMSLECYSKMWDYIKRTYNVDETRVYGFGKSAGGGISTILISNKPTLFNFRAVGLLAPALELVCSMLEMLARRNNELLTELGCPNPNVRTGLSGYDDGRPATDPDKQYVIDNAQKIIVADPFFASVIGMDKMEFVTQMLNTGNADANLEANETLAALVDASARIVLSPVKIWHAIDDENVPIATSKWFQKMVRNGGGECYLREFPANCGQHHAVDNAASAPTTSYVTPFGETITIATAYAELADWFNRW